MKGFVQGQSGSCSYKANSVASRVYQEISGCQGRSVPIETDSGFEQSDCSHWDEKCFVRESLTFNGGDKVSKISAATLVDLGYDNLRCNESCAEGRDQSNQSFLCAAL